MSKYISLTEHIAVPVGGDLALERIFTAHLDRGFRRDGNLLARGTRFASYASFAPSKWRTIAVVGLEANVLTVTWAVDVSGQMVVQEEVDVLRNELLWTVAERDVDPISPPDFTYDYGDAVVRAARKWSLAMGVATSACIFVASLIMASLVRDTIPDFDSLLSTTGNVEWVKSRTGHLEFALRGEPRVYWYCSKQGGIGKVARELGAAKHAAVTLRYSAPTPGVAHHHVWEISTEGRPIRTYEDAMRSWYTDNAIGFCVVGLALLLIPLVSIWMGGRAYLRQRKRVRA